MKRLIISLTLGLTLVGSPVIAAETTTVPAGDTTVTTTTTAPADQTSATNTTTATTSGDQAVSTTTTSDSSTSTPTSTPTTTTTTTAAGEVAAPATTVPDAGLTPDSPFYFIDKFLEKIQLILASEADKAKLLDEFAQERLSEAQAVPETSVKADLLNEYISTVDQVKQLIDKQTTASTDSALINSVKLGSTRGLAVLKDLAAKNPTNPGLQKAIDKQETKLAEHLIFAELKQQFKANNQAIEDLEKQIAEAKAAGQDVSALEKQLQDLQAKAEALKDSKQLIKGLRNELKHQIRTNEEEYQKFVNNNLEKYEDSDEDELKIEDKDEDQNKDQNKDIQKKELKEKIKSVKKQAQLERKAAKEQVKNERRELKDQEKAERKQNRELKKQKDDRNEDQYNDNDNDKDHDNDRDE